MNKFLKLALGILLAIIPVSGMAQSSAQRWATAVWPNSPTNNFAVVIPNAQVYVCVYNSQLACTTPLTIYSSPSLSSSSIITQPLTASVSGVYSFYVPTGTHFVEKVCGTYSQCTYNDVLVGANGFVNSISGGTGIYVTSTGGNVVVNCDVSSFSGIGCVKPDDTSTTVDSNGTIHAITNLSGALTMDVIPPSGVTQYTIIHPTSYTLSSPESTKSTANNTSADLFWSCTGISCNIQPSTQVVWSGFSLPSGISPSNVTAVYAYSVNSQYAVDPTLTESGFTCGSYSVIPSGDTWSMQQTTALTSYTGSNLNTITCTDTLLAGGAPGPAGIAMNVSDVGLIVAYTGTPITAPTYTYVAPPLYYNPSLSLLGIDPTQMFPGLNLLSQTVGNLPAIPTPGATYRVNNGSTLTDCSTGGGSYIVDCFWTGSSWVGYSVGGASEVYPGAGIANSTGSAWGTSYSATNNIPANFLPKATNSSLGTAECDGSTTTCSGGVITAIGTSSGIQYPTGNAVFVSASLFIVDATNNCDVSGNFRLNNTAYQITGTNQFTGTYTTSGTIAVGNIILLNQYGTSTFLNGQTVTITSLGSGTYTGTLSPGHADVSLTSENGEGDCAGAVPGVASTKPFFKNVTVVNRGGGGGWTSSNILSQFTSDVAPFMPATTAKTGYAVIMPAGNDWASYCPTLATVEGNYSAWMALVHSQGGTVVAASNMSNITPDLLDCSSAYYSYSEFINWWRQQGEGPQLSPTVGTTASASSGSTSLTVASATGIAKYQAVTGSGIAVGTYVTNVSGTTITINQNTTASLSSTPVTFYTGYWDYFVDLGSAISDASYFASSGTYAGHPFETTTNLAANMVNQALASQGPMVTADPQGFHYYSSQLFFNNTSPFTAYEPTYGGSFSLCEYENNIYNQSNFYFSMSPGCAASSTLFSALPVSGGQAFVMNPGSLLGASQATSGAGPVIHPPTVGLSMDTTYANQFDVGDGALQDVTGGLGLGFIRGPSSAPSGSCASSLGGEVVTSQDGHITYCPIGGGTWTAFTSSTTYPGTVTYTSSQTASSSDNGKLVVMNCSSSCSYTLPATQPSTTWNAKLETVGTTNATVVLGGSDTFNSSTSVPVLNQFRIMAVYADSATSTNYWGEAPLVSGANVTFTQASNGMTIAASGGGGGVSSWSGDGALYTNSSSTGAVTATLGAAGAHKWWGNNTGSTATPGYESIGASDVPGFDSVTVTGTPIAGQVPTATSGTAATWQTPSGGTCGSGNIPCTNTANTFNGGTQTIVTPAPTTVGQVLKGSSGTASITQVQAKNCTATNACAFASNVTAGDDIVVLCSVTGSGTAASDTFGSTYNQITLQHTVYGTFMAFKADNVTGGADTVTCTTSGSGNFVQIFEFSGLASGATSDGTAVNGTPGSSPSTVSITTTAQDILFTGLGGLDEPYLTLSFNSGWTVQLTDSGLYGATATQQGSAGTYNGTATYTVGHGASNYYQFIFALKAATLSSQSTDLLQAQGPTGTILAHSVTGQGYSQPYTGAFSTLSTCNSTLEGARAGVTDSTTNTFGATIAGSGSYHVPAYCNGTNWVVM